MQILFSMLNINWNFNLPCTTNALFKLFWPNCNLIWSKLSHPFWRLSQESFWLLQWLRCLGKIKCWKPDLFIANTQFWILNVNGLLGMFLLSYKWIQSLKAHIITLFLVCSCVYWQPLLLLLPRGCLPSQREGWRGRAGSSCPCPPACRSPGRLPGSCLHLQ